MEMEELARSPWTTMDRARGLGIQGGFGIVELMKTRV